MKVSRRHELFLPETDSYVVEEQASRHVEFGHREHGLADQAGKHGVQLNHCQRRNEMA
jgi:hypothetical protein